MSKKVKFSDRNEVKEIYNNDSKFQEESLNDENYNDIDGQEDETIRNDGDIEIMPFNLKEELSEGRYDREGNYVRSKDNMPSDPWLETINWKNINFKSKNNSKIAEKKLESDIEITTNEKLLLFERLLTLLNDGETVIKAIKRYGNSKSNKETIIMNETVTSSYSNKKRLNTYNNSEISPKKEKVSSLDIGLRESNQQLMQKMLIVTEIADKLLNQGEFHIYEFSKETISHHIKFFKEKADDFMLENAYNNNSTTRITKPKDFDTLIIDENNVYWEYKWNSNEESEIYGPFPTQQMIQWKNEGYFNNDEMICRQTGNKDRPFTLFKRIDFDLFF